MEENKKKIYLVFGAIAVLVLIAGVIIWIWLGKRISKEEEELLPKAPREENPYGTLPETKSLTNPLENSPELNPVEKVNPYKDAYKNPFE